jgi:DNA-binding transcriptional LysR family regulator
MNIPLHLLQSLVAFSDHISLEKAAAALRTTQPTVTRHLQQLQLHIKSPLFESQGKRKVLTPFGVQLVRQIRERLDSLDDIVRTTEIEFGDPRNVTLRVGARTEILKRLFTEIPFDCSVHLLPMSGSSIQHAIESSTVDLAVGKEFQSPSAFVRKRLFEDGFSCVVPQDFLKSAETSLEQWLARCAKFPFAEYAPQVAPIKATLSAAMGGFRLNTQCTVGDWQVIERRVRAGLAWSVIPDSFLPNVYSYRRFPFPLAGRSIFYVYYRKSLRQHAWFRSILESLHRQVESFRHS